MCVLSNFVPNSECTSTLTNFVAKMVLGDFVCSKKRIGKGKVGWNKAATALKTPRPKWIKGHGTRGGRVRVSVDHPIFPSVMVSNEISYMQKHGARNRIMQKAIKSQTDNLRKRTQQAIEAAARKAKMKA